jgi:putative NADH-flavin reductase
MNSLAEDTAMTAALFGGTGQTGRRLLDELLTRGWTVRALVRNRSRLTRSGPLTVLEGDARDLPTVTDTIRSADAVFCCLGMSDIAHPMTDFSDSVKTILRAMHDLGVRRILAVASAGVLDHPDGGYRFSQGIPDWLRNISAEHVRNYEALRDSGLDWTLMCPLTLAGDIPAGHGRFAYDDLPPGSADTGYDDLARTMAELTSVREAFGRRVGIVSDRP